MVPPVIVIDAPEPIVVVPVVLNEPPVHDMAPVTVMFPAPAIVPPD